MRQLAFFVCASMCLAGVSCDSSSVEPEADGHLEVFVQREDQGLADVRVQIVETGAEQRTDASGIARFTAAPGTYTVRAYGLNGGGPPAPVDQSVVLRPDETVRVEFFDCVLCLSTG